MDAQSPVSGEVFKEALSKTIKPKPGRITAILINGPPLAGKDEAAKAICSIPGLEPIWRPFAHELKAMCGRLFNSGKSWTYYEHMKDKPHSDFRGMTPREMYIWMAEEVIKPKFGITFFPDIALEYYFSQIHKNGSSVKNSHTNPLLVSDCGFNAELPPILKRFKISNCLIIRVKRRGHTFENDSREYIRKKNGLHVVDIKNNSTLADYKTKVIDVARTFLEG